MKNGEVLERVRQAAAENATFLDLHSSELTSLPLEIGQLTSLTGLHLGSNELTSLPGELGQLSNLADFNVGENQLSLPPEIAAKRYSPRDILACLCHVSIATRPLIERPFSGEARRLLQRMQESAYARLSRQRRDGNSTRTWRTAT